MMLNHSTIRITKETRGKLASVGKKFQSYDQIIQELLSKWNDEN